MSPAFDKEKVYTAIEMALLISENPHQWFLLEVLKEDENKRAKELKLLSLSKDKEDLYELLMEDESWSWEKKYIFVYSDPDKKCELL